MASKPVFFLLSSVTCPNIESEKLSIAILHYSSFLTQSGLAGFLLSGDVSGTQRSSGNEEAGDGRRKKVSPPLQGLDSENHVVAPIVSKLGIFHRRHSWPW